MATEVRRGTFFKIMTEIEAEGRVRSRVALMELALVVEKQAKINARTGSHKYGTPTPARPGTGPATISGNLRRSITHEPIVRDSAGGYSIKVGTAIGFYPSYPGVKSRTPANKYGYYLENGLRNGDTYPFLMPAFKFAIGVPAKLIYDKAFGSGWRAIA